MANFAIMRCKKLSGMGSVASSLQHCYRDRETPNADSEQTQYNQRYVSESTDEAMGRLRELLPEKRRKDAVLAIEYVMTASPEWFETATPREQATFFTLSKMWLEDKYGKDRVVAAVVHRDEATPHLSAYVVPLTEDGRLSAKEFIGSRSKMRDDQTSFAESVARVGLERGIKGSQATHQTVQHYYESLNRGISKTVTIEPEYLKPQVLKKGVFTRQVESETEIAKRLSGDINKAFSGTVAMASQSEHNAKRVSELQSAMVQQQKRLEKFVEPFRGLSSEQAQEVLALAKQFQEQNRKREIEQRMKREMQTKERLRERGGFTR